MTLPDEEEELETVPNWIVTGSTLLTQVVCPGYLVCKWSRQFLEVEEDELTCHKEFEDHWREHHG